MAKHAILAPMKPLCHICDTPSAHLLTKDGYDLYRCARCRLAFVYPQPTLEYLRTEVYSAESGFQKGRAEDLAKYKPSARYVEMYRLLSAHKPHAKLLDVGSGGGQFIYHAKQEGFGVAGVELNKRLVDSSRAQGFEVYHGTLAEAGIPGSAFDAVVLGEVIEHVNDPRSLVRDSARVLKPDGVLLITTPNADCVWSRATLALYRLFRIPWSTATPPYHLFQFSASNLDLLLSQERFQRVDTAYLPPPRIGYELGSLHLLKRFKVSRNPIDLAYLAFAFALYIPLYGFCRLAHPFVHQDFSMLHVYRRA